MRNILHSDMNNFYASVECMLNPSLKGKPVAVCGSVEERHGIVLAKNYPAKAYGVQTGEAVWQAQQKCPGLVIVPPHFDEYIKYSKLAREVYGRYTNQVEPYGMDECWLDISEYNGRNPEAVAYEIKETMKEELGLTVSVGVSYNKIFAKLGSDMKKPDAVTVIPENSFKEKIWHLPASDLLFVGRATKRTLDRFCIRTIGDLATMSEDDLQRAIMSAVQTVAMQNTKLLQTLKNYIAMIVKCDDSEDRKLEIKVRLAEINEEFQKAMSLVSVDDDNNLVIEQRLTELIMEKEMLNKELAKYSDEDSANSQSKVNEIVRLTDILENQPLQFNDELIRQMLQCVVVESKERIKVIFNDGTEIDQPV